MANPFINQGVDMQSPEAVQIMRRQKMAEQLLQQSQDPLQGQMISGHYVGPSWTQQLAKGLQGYLGRKELQATDEAQARLNAGAKERNQADMAKFVELLQGKPAQTVEAMPVQDESGYRQEGFNRQITERPAQAPDLNAAYQFAMASQNPALQQAGMNFAMQMPQMQAQQAARQEERAWRSQEAEANRAARAEELQQRMQDARSSQAERLAAQKELREMQIQAQKDTQRMIAANRQPPQAQIIQTDSGPMQLVGGKAVPILGPDGKPVRPAATASGAAKPLTESQAKGSLYLGQMRSATGVLDKLGDVSPIETAATGKTWTNWAASEKAQKVAQAQNQWAEAYLRAKTGAAATPGEVELNKRTFFPVVGDKPENIEQKRLARIQAERDMEPVAGPGAERAGGAGGEWDSGMPPADAIAAELARRRKGK